MHFLQKVLATTLIIFPCCLYAQPLTLDSAYQLAKSNYPLIKQRELIKQTTDLNLENLSKGHLPQFAINAQGTYQSEVTQVSIPLPGVKIDPLSKDQYKITADVSQLVYDGGLIREQKLAQQLIEKTDAQKLEVELYKLKDRVNQLFLGIFLIDEQLKQASLMKADIENGIKKTEALVQNGTAFRSNLNALKAESLKADQRIIELKAVKEYLVNTLSIFIGKPLPQDVILAQPSNPSLQNNINRPELSLYQAQASFLEQQKKLLRAKNQPKASLFLQGGYGRPGLNMLKNEFDWFYITGIRVNWSLSGLYTYRNEIRLTDINKQMIDIQKETFLLNLNSQLPQQQSEINKYEKLIDADIQIIELRKSVKEAALAQLENGVITSNDYLREVNAEDQARVSLITHQLQLLQAKINYQTITGN
jgi:outer membrane protein TolC